MHSICQSNSTEIFTVCDHRGNWTHLPIATTKMIAIHCLVSSEEKILFVYKKWYFFGAVIFLVERSNISRYLFLICQHIFKKIGKIKTFTTSCTRRCSTAQRHLNVRTFLPTTTTYTSSPLVVSYYWFVLLRMLQFHLI